MKDTLAGQKLTLRVGDEDRTITVHEIVKVSLGTKETSQAKTRHASVQARLQERRAVARKGPVALTHDEVMGLGEIAYRELVAEHRADPGDPEAWPLKEEAGLLFGSL